MIFLFLLLVLVVAVVMVRGQMHRQHREMMGAVNPERLAELDAAANTEARRQWFARLGILGALIVVGVAFWTCSAIPKLWEPKPRTATPEQTPENRTP